VALFVSAKVNGPIESSMPWPIGAAQEMATISSLCELRGW
ncbi:unnamed protein product, partial [Acidithrix sp. C25]